MLIEFLLLTILINSATSEEPACQQGDGKYYQGCNQFFFVCRNGIEHKFACSGNLFFDPKLERCEFKENVKVCQSKVDLSSLGKILISKANCIGKKNGLYALNGQECQKEFFACSNEQTYVRKCPFGQVFLTYTNRCEHESECQSKFEKFVRTKTPARALAMPTLEYSNDSIGIVSEEVERVENGIDCRLLPNARISKFACSSVFFMCSHGKLYKKQCPSDLIYDNEKHICDSKENVNGCKNHDESVNYGGQQEEPANDDSRCAKKEDGFYPFGICKESFYSCINGKLREITCADHLVYDPRINACDYPLACRSPRNHTDIPNLFDHGGISTRVENKTTKFDCSQKTDGFYVQDSCTNEYFQCNNNTAYILNCPKTLVFNKVTETCDFLDSCHKDAIKEIIKDGEDSEEAQETTTTTTAPSVGSDLPSATDLKSSCSTKSNGMYSLGPCENSFMQCWNGRVSISKCPHTLVFNSYKEQCDYPTDVFGCESNKPADETSTTTTTTTSTTESSYQTHEETSSPATTTTKTTTTTTVPSSTLESIGVSNTVDPFCERLDNGIYGFGCSQFYYKCNDFETEKLHCPTGMYYNVDKIMCDQKENVKECQTESGPAMPAPPAYSGIKSSEDSAPSPPSIDLTDSGSKTDFVCIGRVDGIYALPYCTNEYVQCINGNTLLNKCVAGLYYSEKTGMCDYRENVPICDKNNNKPARDATFSVCTGKPDGYYSMGCSTKYFSCIGEKIRKMSCPANLKFSGRKGVCERPQNVEECTLAAQPIQTPPIVDSSFCMSKTNGLYEFAPCSPHYVVCDNNRPTAGTCAAPLVFNSKTELCDYKVNNMNCAY